MIIWVIAIAATILIVALFVRYVVNTRKPKKAPPVCKHAVWPFPSDFYGDGEPKVYTGKAAVLASGDADRTIFYRSPGNTSSSDSGYTLLDNVLAIEIANVNADTPSPTYDSPPVDTSSLDAFGGFSGGGSGQYIPDEEDDDDDYDDDEEDEDEEEY